MPQENITSKQTQTAQSVKQAQRLHVLPEQIPPAVSQVLRQTLKPESIANALKWLVSRISETPDATELADHLAERYEQQILRIKDGVLKEYMPLFRVGFAARCLEILPLFSMKFAQAGYNPLFVKIWFQKRLLASLMGISVADVERRARSSSAKISDYLTDQINRLYPDSCVAQELRQK